MIFQTFYYNINYKQQYMQLLLTLIPILEGRLIRLVSIYKKINN